MENIFVFCLFVGIGSTIVLDVWVLIVEKILKIPPTNWGLVGRWLIGIPRGFLVLNSDTSPSVVEKVVGWLFHYIIGIAYAVLLLLYAGQGFIESPTVLPIFVIGLCLSTLAGLVILMPGLGAGWFGRKLPNQGSMIIYLLVAHLIFSAGQYALSVLY